jgi:phthalate 4,5-dioxygenase oxygenase subunit
MLSKEQNDLLTRIGPGTAGGALLRRYWQPAALSVELPHGGSPLPLRLLGEDLVIFRDDQGRPGLLALHCSHRGTDLSYGRVEDGGLRCLYHGWLYDIHGRCLEQPGEPGGGAQRDQIRHRAYPCVERAGVVFTYMGPGEPPLFPNYEFFTVPDDHRWIHKYYHECSYLQGNEGNLDPVHPFFLHRFLPGSRLKQSRVPIDQERVSPAFDTRVEPPRVEADETEFGVRIYAFYRVDAERTAVRSSNFVLPNLCAVGGGPVPPGDGYLINWHVPIDDTHHWRFSMAFKRSGPIDKAHTRERASVTTPDFRFIRNRQNRYLQDREEQRTDTFSGMGPIFVVHDSCASESTGEIQDRTQEHLVASDRGVARARRMLLRAIQIVQEGEDPPHVIREAERNRFPGLNVTEEKLPADMSIDDYLRQRKAALEPAPAGAFK